MSNGTPEEQAAHKARLFGPPAATAMLAAPRATRQSIKVKTAIDQLHNGFDEPHLGTLHKG